MPLPEFKPVQISTPSPGNALFAAEQIKGFRNRNALTSMEIEDRKKKRLWEEEDRRRALEKHRFQDEIDALEYLYKSSPMITYDNYPEAKEHFEELGLNPEFLHPIESFGPVGSKEARQRFEGYKKEGLTALKEQIEIMKAQKKGAYKPTSREQAMQDFEEKEKIKSKYRDAGKKEWTESQIRKELKNIGIARSKMDMTGGLDPFLYASMAEKAPDVLQKILHEPNKATEYLDEYEDFLRGKLPQGSQTNKGAKTYKRMIFKDGKLIEKTGQEAPGIGLNELPKQKPGMQFTIIDEAKKGIDFIKDRFSK